MFYKDYSDKLIAIFEAIDIALSMIRPIIRPIILKQKQDQSAKPMTKQIALKQKLGWLSNSTNKQVKKNWAAFNFYCVFGFFLRCG